MQSAGHRVALAPREAARRVGVGRIAVASLGQLDAAAREERVHSFEPSAAVDVVPVVGAAVERDEVPARRLAQAQQEIVEDLGPGPGMEDAAVGQDPVEVVQAGGDARRAGRASSVVTGTGESHGSGCDAGQPSELGEQLSRSEPLLHELSAPAVRVRDVHGAVCRGERVVGGVERQLPAHRDRVELRRPGGARRGRRRDRRRSGAGLERDHDSGAHPRPQHRLARSDPHLQ